MPGATPWRTACAPRWRPSTRWAGPPAPLVLANLLAAAHVTLAPTLTELVAPGREPDRGWAPGPRGAGGGRRLRGGRAAGSSSSASTTAGPRSSCAEEDEGTCRASSRPGERACPGSSSAPRPSARTASGSMPTRPTISGRVLRLRPGGHRRRDRRDRPPLHHPAGRPRGRGRVGHHRGARRAGARVAVRHHPGAGDPEGRPDELARPEGHGARRVADRADGDRARRGPARRRGGGRHSRWERIAREAVKQCGRVVVPAIDRPRAFADVAREIAGARRRVGLLGGRRPGARRGGGRRRAAPARLAAPGRPRGGLHVRGGRRWPRSAGARLVSLGPRILRAESAGLTAVALCQFLFGDLGGRGTRVQPGGGRRAVTREGYEYFDVAADVGVAAWGEDLPGMPPAVRARGLQPDRADRRGPAGREPRGGGARRVGRGPPRELAQRVPLRPRPRGLRRSRTCAAREVTAAGRARAPPRRARRSRAAPARHRREGRHVSRPRGHARRRVG